jgi:hypothetical protein
MERLAAALATSAVLGAWRRLYRLNVNMKEDGFDINFMPFPPDTYDSVREDVLSGKLDELRCELRKQGVSAFVDYERCSFGLICLPLLLLLQ